MRFEFTAIKEDGIQTLCDVAKAADVKIEFSKINKTWSRQDDDTRGVAYVHINTLDQLMRLYDAAGRCGLIISGRTVDTDDDMLSIEIYDDYV